MHCSELYPLCPATLTLLLRVVTMGIDEEHASYLTSCYDENVGSHFYGTVNSKGHPEKEHQSRSTTTQVTIILLYNASKSLKL